MTTSLLTQASPSSLWRSQYLAETQVLPEQADPPWSLGQKVGEAEATLVEGVLRIDTRGEGSSGDSRMRYDQINNWTGLEGSEAEFLLRVVEPIDPAMTAAAILIKGEAGWQSIGIGVDFLICQGTRIAADFSDFTTVRVQIVGEGQASALEVRLNQEQTPALIEPLLPHEGDTQPLLAFGDLSATPRSGGLVDWKSIRWTSGGALTQASSHSPTLQPSTTALAPGELPINFATAKPAHGAEAEIEGGDSLLVRKKNGTGYISVAFPPIAVSPSTAYKVTFETDVPEWQYGMFFSLQIREHHDIHKAPVGSSIRTHPEMRVVLPTAAGAKAPHFLEFTTGPETRFVRVSGLLTGNPGAFRVHAASLTPSENEHRDREERPFDALDSLEELNAHLAQTPQLQGSLVSKEERFGISSTEKPLAPILYQRTYWTPEDSLHTLFAEAGVGIHVTQLAIGPYRLEGARYVPGVWVDHRKYDFSSVDAAVERALRAAPTAKIIAGLEMTPYRGWGDRFPDEVIQNEKGEKGVGRSVHNIAYRNQLTDDELEFWCPSLASEQYLEDSAEVIRAVIAHMQTQPYWKQVVGFMLYGGDDGQWGSWARSGPLNHGDFSPAGIKAWQEWLRKKYGSAKALRDSWGAPEAEFNSAAVPSISARRPEGRVFYLHREDKPVIDYLAFDAEVKGRAIDRMAKTIKEAAGKRVLVGSYFQDAFYGRENNAYGELPRLRSPYLDFFTSPLDYGPWRRPGWAGGTFSASVDSLRLHRKLYLCELDLRTAASRFSTAAYEHNIIGRLEDAASFNAVNLRETGLLAAYGMGQWYYAMAGGSFYADYAIRGVEQAASIAQEQLDRESVPAFPPQVAVFADGVTNSHLNRLYQGLLYPALNITRSSLFLSGVPVSIYEMEDLMDSRLPEFKVYVFLNAWYLNAQQRAYIDEVLKKNGKTLIWIATAGYLDENGASAKHIESTTGFRVKVGTTVEPLNVKPAENAPAPFHRLLPRQGTAYELLRGVRLVVEDPEAIPLGVYTDTGDTANAMKKLPGHQSVFIATPGGLGPDLLNAISEYAGVSPVSDPGNLAFLRNGLLILHGVAGGDCAVRLPEKCRVTDLLNQKVLYDAAKEFTIPLPVATTRLFRIDSLPEE